jgi:hypothetical protein
MLTSVLMFSTLVGWQMGELPILRLILRVRSVQPSFV